MSAFEIDETNCELCGNRMDGLTSDAVEVLAETGFLICESCVEATLEAVQ